MKLVVRGIRPILAAIGMAIAISSNGHAAIIGTYVDADLSNTVLNTSIQTIPPENDSDNLWFLRDQAGTQGGTVLTSAWPMEDAPQLTTTVTGLTNGLYDIYIIYWTVPIVSDSVIWQVQAGISGEPLVEFTELNGTATGNVIGTITERQAYLGRFNVTSGSFSVDIDDGIILPTPGGDGRSWYDGVSYQAVPEPSMFALIGLGLVGTITVRRMKVLKRVRQTTDES